MTLNVVCLSPHFPPNFEPFWLHLQAQGARVLGIGDSPWENLSPALQNSLGEYYRVANMDDQSQLEQACEHFVEKWGPLHWLESHNEYWLEREALLRTRFAIPGVSSAQIMDIKSKSRMKEIYRQAGIPVAPGGLAPTLEAAQAVIANTGFPLVAKPDIGVGAARTYRISCETELKSLYTEQAPENWLLEQYIDGELYSFDGLVNQQGEIIFYAAHHFSQGIMDTVNEDQQMFYYSLRDIPAELEDLGRRTVAAFGIRMRFFHLEFFRQPDGQWVALEVNMRAPGGLTTDLFNYANDIDIYREWGNVLLHNRFDSPVTRPYHACYVGRKQRPYRLNHEALKSALGSALVHDTPIPEIFHKVMGHHGYIIRHPELPEVLRMVSLIQGI